MLYFSGVLRISQARFPVWYFRDVLIRGRGVQKSWTGSKEFSGFRDTGSCPNIFKRLFSTLYTCPRDRVRGVEIDLGKTCFAREPYQGAPRAPVNQKLSHVGHLARKYLRFRVPPGAENPVFGKNPVVVYLRKIYDHLRTINSFSYDNCKKNAWRRLNAAS